MALIDVFATKKTPQITQNIQPQQNPDEYTSYRTRGTRDAGLCEGSPQSLLPKLHATYIQLIRIIQRDEQQQNERRSKVRQEICGLEARKANIENQIQEEQDNLSRENNRIREIKEEIDNIRRNPGIALGDSFSKASFWIGLMIILFLTVYLFVFYSSAAYSAFFKDFTPDDTKITQAIFDAQAVGKAWADGFTEFIFIMAIPAVFLGLGFLIHKFSEEKGFSKYLKISALVVVTFIFDFIIAYAIVKEIYNIRIGGLFYEMPPMTIERAFQEINFWIIIFAGFVVYIIWGLVFTFIMSEYEKLNKGRYAIKIREQNLADYESNCESIRGRLSISQREKNDIQGEIDKSKIQIETYIVYFDDVRGGINDYCSGWVVYLSSVSAPQADILKCNEIREEFLSGLRNSEFIKDA